MFFSNYQKIVSVSKAKREKKMTNASYKFEKKKKIEKLQKKIKLQR